MLEMVAATEESMALYALSPTVLERPRAMSRLRLPVSTPDSILQRSTGNPGTASSERVGLFAM